MPSSVLLILLMLVLLPVISFFCPPSFISVAVGQLGPSGIEVRAAHESQRQHTSCYTAYAQAAYVVMQRIELHALKAAAAPCCNELIRSLSLSVENERERERASERARESLRQRPQLSSEERLAHARSAR